MYQITKHINRLEFLDHIFNYVTYDLFVDILGCASEAYKYQLNVFNVAIFSTDSRRNNNVISTSKLRRNGVLRKNGVIKAKTVIFRKAHGGHLGKRRPHWNDQSYFPHSETYHTSIPNRLLKRLLPLQGDIKWKDFAWPALFSCRMTPVEYVCQICCLCHNSKDSYEMCNYLLHCTKYHTDNNFWSQKMYSILLHFAISIYFLLYFTWPDNYLPVFWIDIAVLAI